MRHVWYARKGRSVFFLIFGALLFGLIVMQLWNALVPDLFHGPVLSYWQSVGLLVLSHIFFRGGCGSWRGGHRRDDWKKRFEEKLAGMTPEEQEKFKEEWKKRCQ